MFLIESDMSLSCFMKELVHTDVCMAGPYGPNPLTARAGYFASWLRHGEKVIQRLATS